MILRKFLIKVWRDEKVEVGDIISFLEAIGSDSVAEILRDVSQREISVTKAEVLLKGRQECQILH